MSGYSVADLGSITPTSSGSANSRIFTNLDDADSIGIFITSSANGQTSGIYVTHQNTTAPTLWFRYSSTGGAAPLTSSGAGQTITISPVNFRSMRFSGLTSATATEPLGFVTKQIFV